MIMKVERNCGEGKQRKREANFRDFFVSPHLRSDDFYFKLDLKRIKLIQSFKKLLNF